MSLVRIADGAGCGYKPSFKDHTSCAISRRVPGHLGPAPPQADSIIGNRYCLDAFLRH